MEAINEILSIIPVPVAVILMLGGLVSQKSGAQPYHSGRAGDSGHQARRRTQGVVRQDAAPLSGQ